jgi:G:T/U-mismatch repair DNA glycosylase
MNHEEQKAFAEFYRAHPEIANCEANTHALYKYHNGDEITLESLEDSAPRLSLAKAGKRQSFDEFRREHQVSDCEANRQLYGSGFDDPAVFAPMSPAELDQARSEAIEEYNEGLRNASALELRQIAQQEAADRRAAAVQAEADRHLKAAQARDAAYGFPPLPETWQGSKLDAYFIKTCSADTQKLLQRRFGSAALDRRLHGLN